MNITCNVITDLLPLYLDGAASEDTKKIISAHLKTCRFCRDALLRMKENGKTKAKIKDVRNLAMADYAELARRMRTRRLVTYTSGGLLILGLLGYSIYKTVTDV